MYLVNYDMYLLKQIECASVLFTVFLLHKGEEEKTKAEKQFQLIAEAYEILSDTDLRGRYDRGEEVLPNQGNGGQPQGHPFPFHNFHQGGQQFHFNFGGRF
jgi:curved DNA-binding protein CbpA